MGGDEIELRVCSQKDDDAQAYERLIADAMIGDAALFARQDAVEAAWPIVDPILRLIKPVYVYGSGGWGRRRPTL